MNSAGECGWLSRILRNVLQQAVETPEVSGVRVSDLRFLIKTARPGFWTTSIWFYMLPLGQRWLFNRASFWIGLLYVTLPLGLILYGFNDLADAETDRLNPRKGNFLFGARGDDQQLAALPLRILAVQLPFLIGFAVLFGFWRAVVWFAAVFAVTACYNWPVLGTKNWPIVDLLTQAGYLLVFVVSSWANAVPQLPWYTFVFGALFAMHSHLFGQIMDIDPDRAAGRHTTAVVIGSVDSKLLLSALLVAEAALVSIFARDWLITAFLAGSSLWFLLDALVLWKARPYSAGQMRFFFLGWNAAAVLSLPIVWQFGKLGTAL